MPQRHEGRLRLLIFTIVLGLAGCSALSLAYRHAPTLAVLWIDRALDLPAAHRALLADAAEEVYRWHLGEPREELAAILREAQRRVAGPVAPADGEWLVERLQDHVRRVGERLAGTLGPRLPPLSAAELARIGRRLAERRAEDAQEMAIDNPAVAIVRRSERVEAAVSDWLGSVDERERELIAAAPAVSEFDARLWLGERTRREQALVAALAADDDGVALAAWFRDWRVGRAPDVDRALKRQREATIAMWVRLVNQASDTQRQHLRERLGNWAAALEDARR